MQRVSIPLFGLTTEPLRYVCLRWNNSRDDCIYILLNNNFPELKLLQHDMHMCNVPGMSMQVELHKVYDYDAVAHLSKITYNGFINYSAIIATIIKANDLAYRFELLSRCGLFKFMSDYITGV